MLDEAHASVAMGVATGSLMQVMQPIGGLGMFFSLPWQVWFIFILLWLGGSFVRLVVELQAETIRPGWRKGGIDILVIFCVGGISAFIAFGFCEALGSLLQSTLGWEFPVFLTAISIATASFNLRMILDKFSAKLGKTIEETEIFKGKP